MSTGLGNSATDQFAEALLRSFAAIFVVRAELERHGLEAGGLTAEGEALAGEIEARLRTGRPLSTPAWIAQYEGELGRTM